MFGMKINFDKSEVFVVGVESSEHQRIVEIFGCKMGTFPITYLGLPVSDCKLTKGQLSYVGDKVMEVDPGTSLLSRVPVSGCLPCLEYPTDRHSAGRRKDPLRIAMMARTRHPD